MTVIADKNTVIPSDRWAAFQAVYDEHLTLLLGLAIERGVPESDAQTLTHEVFLAYFLKADDVRDVRAWLVGAICNASKHYFRNRDRNVPITEAVMNGARPHQRQLVDVLGDQIASREALSCLTARCQGRAVHAPRGRAHDP